MKIIHISAECFPIAKVGGLADVVGALPKYQVRAGEESTVIMPLYDNAFAQKETFETIYTAELNLASKPYSFTVKRAEDFEAGFELLFIDVPELLFKPYVYSSEDTERFIAFQIAALDFIISRKSKVDVIHCHDHHTGLIPFMMSHCKQYASLKETPSILTIHNAQYQGWISYEEQELLPSFDQKDFGLLDWSGCINSLAAGIKCAWHVTTVSKTYLEEMKLHANGLESLISAEFDKCSGILNGIDTKVWDSETDDMLVKNYSRTSIQSGKKANKAQICKDFGLDAKKPLVVFIGRLVYEKGADLFPEAFKAILDKGESSLFLLGSGDSRVEEEMRTLCEDYPGSFNAHIGYNEALAHNLYGGADFLLMPSRIEPCGLNQMYSLRYGTVPIVSQVGGLKDTVVDIDDSGFGICMREVSSPEIIEGVSRALELFADQKTYRKIRKEIMKIDHSWSRSAEQYISVYKSLIP